MIARLAFSALLALGVAYAVGTWFDHSVTSAIAQLRVTP